MFSPGDALRPPPGSARGLLREAARGPLPEPSPPWPGRFPCIAGRLLGPPRDARISDPFVSTNAGKDRHHTKPPRRPLPPAGRRPWRRSPDAPPRPTASDQPPARYLPKPSHQAQIRPAGSQSRPNRAAPLELCIRTRRRAAYHNTWCCLVDSPTIRWGRPVEILSLVPKRPIHADLRHQKNLHPHPRLPPPTPTTTHGRAPPHRPRSGSRSPVILSDLLLAVIPMHRAGSPSLRPHSSPTPVAAQLHAPGALFQPPFPGPPEPDPPPRVHSQLGPSRPGRPQRENTKPAHTT